MARFDTNKRKRSTPGVTTRGVRSPAPGVERFHTSATELSGFRTCRRRWHLQDVQHLAPKAAVAWYLIFGTCVHDALEAYYKGDRDLPATLRAFKRAWTREDRILQEKYGSFYSMGIEEEWNVHLERGQEMLRHYHTFDRAHPFWERVIDFWPEERSFVNILNPDTREPMEGLPLLSGRPDIVAQRYDGIWIVDHKALASSPQIKYLDIDDQGTAYCYIYWRQTGVVPHGFLYNVLIKDPPKPPRVLADGSLSKDKSQRTTLELYLAAIDEYGFDRADYADMLTFLENKGWSQFFVRDGSPRNLDQLLEFERHLYYVTLDMMRATEDPVAHAYPNPTQYTCGGCSVLGICQAMEERGNVEWVIDNGYVAQDPRIVIPKKILSPKWKGV